MHKIRNVVHCLISNYSDFLTTRYVNWMQINASCSDRRSNVNTNPQPRKTVVLIQMSHISVQLFLIQVVKLIYIYMQIFFSYISFSIITTFMNFHNNMNILKLGFTIDEGLSRWTSNIKLNRFITSTLMIWPFSVASF